MNAVAAYNNNLHEEAHRLNNLLYPHLPPRATEAGHRVVLADDEDMKVDEDDLEEVESNDEGIADGDEFGMDSEHDE